MAQVIEHLPSALDALSSIPSITYTHTKKKKKKERNEKFER
jgi:hypothetical protein